MFWAFTLLVGLAVVFIKLGAYSVTVAILSGSLKLVIILVVMTVLWLFLKKKLSFLNRNITRQNNQPIDGTTYLDIKNKNEKK